jgi:hypothetical protein
MNGQPDGSAKDQWPYHVAPGTCGVDGTSESRQVAKGGLKHSPWRRLSSSGIRFDSQPIVHSNPELLLASQVAFRRLFHAADPSRKLRTQETGVRSLVRDASNRGEP